MFKTVVDVNQDRIYLLLAALASVGSLLWLVINELMSIDMVAYPFDLLIAMTCLATYWFKQYFKSLEESQQLAAKLKGADKKKDHFLADVAHEMRNPLHGIVNISQAVIERERDQLTDRSKQDLRLLHDVGRRMSFLLNDLLELAKFRENRITLQKKAVSVQSAASAVISMLNYLVEGKPITLHTQISERIPPVLADENRLVQILFNLVHNAIKYSEKGQISIQASYLDGMIRVSVVDQGIGMSEEDIEVIFKPYIRLQGEASRTGGFGFGLGLNICKQLVELHGSKLSVKSKLNEGSVFSFTLPVASVNEADLIELASVVKEQRVAQKGVDEPVGKLDIETKTIRILAVDDDYVNLKVLESIFYEERYSLCLVSSGQEALEKIEAEKWDIVISDVMMPKMTGYELTERIRKLYPITELPVLLLTAYNQELDIETGFRAGANDYVSKPVHGLELKARVQSLVHLKRSVKEALKLEAAWLQAQIKPHFLINTFNAVAALSRTDLDRMDALIDQLSRYIRYSIHFQNSDDLIPFTDELELVRSYVNIERERFPDYFEVVWKIDEVPELYVPPMAIQTIVENAIHHGLITEKGKGILEIEVSDCGTYVMVTIRDDGIGMSEDSLEHLVERKECKHSGIGLANTNYRIKQQFGNGLKVKSEIGKGTEVSFTIPK
ncbi:ATP-binding protein [Bacillus sp. JCM 19034]|uniref:ATP-binding protein n=1 Tax=Bacillus sp. JCM 19034 TaxID=1481928 RepID=UPI000784E083|nr:ATP-binding protein [Bacillus sp. JCM 19034]